MNVIVLVGIDFGVIFLRGETVNLTTRIRKTQIRNISRQNIQTTKVRYKILSYGMKLAVG